MRPRPLLAAIVAAVLVAGCDGCATNDSESPAKRATRSGEESTTEDPHGLATVPARTKADVVRTGATLAHATYLDASERAEWLRETVRYLLDRPSPDALDAARQAWLATRGPLCQTEVFAFDQPRAARLSARPVAPDDLRAPDTGILRRPNFELQKSTLVERSTSAAPLVGAYAVEFGLWGPRNDQRRHGSFEVHGPDDRRDRRLGEWLKTTTELLVEDTSALAETWNEDGATRRRFTGDTDRAIRRWVSNMVSLHERLLEKQLRSVLQADRPRTLPARYSRATRREIRARFHGMENLYRGRYVRTDHSEVSGTSLAALVQRLDPTLHRRLHRRFDRSAESLEQLPEPLVQSDLSPAGRSAVQAAIEALTTLGTSIDRLAKRCGVETSVH